jgi:hypothetical protein
MKKFIALLLIFSVISLYGNMYAKEKRGIDLLVQKTDGVQIRGELIAVKKNSLLLKESESGADMTVDVDDLKVITIVKKSKVWIGGGYGFLGGASLGAVIGIALGDDPPGWFSYTAAEKAFMFGAALGLIGIIIGGIFGAASGTDETIHFETMSEQQINFKLENLRKKARVPNFQ